MGREGGVVVVGVEGWGGGGGKREEGCGWAFAPPTPPNPFTPRLGKSSVDTDVTADEKTIEN